MSDTPPPSPTLDELFNRLDHSNNSPEDMAALIAELRSARHKFNNPPPKVVKEKAPKKPKAKKGDPEPSLADLGLLEPNREFDYEGGA